LKESAKIGKNGIGEAKKCKKDLLKMNNARYKISIIWNKSKKKGKILDCNPVPKRVSWKLRCHLRDNPTLIFLKLPNKVSKTDKTINLKNVSQSYYFLYFCSLIKPR
jgi:hypothetical protein